MGAVNGNKWTSIGTDIHEDDAFRADHYWGWEHPAEPPPVQAGGPAQPRVKLPIFTPAEAKARFVERETDGVTAARTALGEAGVLQVPMPPQFDFSGAILDNRGTQGTLHTILRHSPEWRSVIPGFDAVYSDLTKETRKIIETISGMRHNKGNRVKDAIKDFLGSVIEIADCKAFQNMQQLIYNYLLAHINADSYSGEGRNSCGLEQIFFEINRDSEGQEITRYMTALMSESIPLRAFWWLMLVMCIICGVTTTTLVVLEYIEGPTQTSTTIRLVDSLELPGITICPKVPDIFDEKPLFRDISASLPNLTYDVQLDVVRYFIAGNGLENIDAISRYNASYLQQLDLYYRLWSRGYSTQEFFYLIHIVIRRGVCFQTRAALNQTEADDVGRLVLSMRALRTMTSPEYNYTQPQLLVYVTDNHDIVVDYPRYYLYPQQFSRMRLTARFMELIQSNDVCTNKVDLV
ncbi:unnamed protein product, partial [Mesorhabditis spiculigera]